jgi:dipeptidyl aminopeptidase/acylaminoacyl peptidase
LTNDPYLEHLLTLPEVMHARLSPDGCWVAFVWYRRHENFDIFLAPSDGSAAPVALTHTPEATGLVSWSADSEAVIVTEDHNGDERRALYRVDIAHPLRMQLLTEERPPYFVRGGSLLPSGDALIYAANYDFAAGRTILPTWVYRHNLLTGERRAIARPLKPINMEVSLNSTGTHVLYSRKDRHPAGRQFHVVDVEGREDREITHFGEQVKTFARWFPDGENILVLSESTHGEPQAYNSLAIYHLPSGELRWLVDDPQRMIEGAWVSRDGTIIIDEVQNAGHVTSALNPTSGDEIPFPRLPGNLIPIGRAANNEWIAMYYSSVYPTDVVRFNAQAQSLDDLASLTSGQRRSTLLAAHYSPGESFNWRSIDGQAIQGWLFRAQPNTKRAVILIHGGPTSHSEDRLEAETQYLVGRGFNVLDVNYRGSTGFGLSFREAIKEDGWGGREQADIATGAQALIQAGLALPGKVGVTGTSYGGYSSWRQITTYPPEVIAAAAPICGMTDLRVDYETTRPDLRPYSEEMIGGSPEQIPDKYAERSPINYIQNIRGRLLIIQGGQDPNVTPENVRLVRQRLDERNIPYELLVFEDEGHGVYKPANEAVLYTRLADFFDEALD